MPIIRKSPFRTVIPKPSYPLGSQAAKLARQGYRPTQIDRTIQARPGRGAGAHPTKVNPALQRQHAAAVGSRHNVLSGRGASTGAGHSGGGAAGGGHGGGGGHH